MIYFDMDGVLADFDWGVKNLLGMPCYAQGDRKKPHRFDDQLFTAIRECGDFYLRLPPIEDGVRLFEHAVRLCGPSNVAILTGIPRPERNIPEAADNKRAWCEKCLPCQVEVIAVPRREKPDYARSRDDVLIDDFAANIKEWEKAGGTGVLFTDFGSAEKKLMDVWTLAQLMPDELP